MLSCILSLREPPQKIMFHAYEEPRLPPTTDHKFFPAVIKNACARCYCFRNQAHSSLNLEEEETPYSDHDNQHVIVLAIQSRDLKARARNKSGLFIESLSWALSPTSGKLPVAPKGHHAGEEDEGGCDDDETKTFFTVKSYFSLCSNKSESDPMFFHRRSLLEECEGWPFGLWRKAVVLPPLPSCPSDSWTWRRRNLVAKICTTI